MNSKRWLIAATWAVLVGGAVSVTGPAPGEAAVGETHLTTIPASGFVSRSGATDYTNDGISLRVNSGSTPGYFVAFVSFPIELDHVRINRITFRYLDNGPSTMCFRVYWVRPKSADGTEVGETCTEGAEPTQPRNLNIRKIRPAGPNPVTAFQLWLSMPVGATTYRFYGATIEWQEI